MPDLTSYALADLIPVEPEVYFRLFERLNGELWPWPLFGVPLGLAILTAAWRGYRRACALALAGAWLLVGWQFHHQLLAELTWVADYLAWGFYLQALALILRGFGPDLLPKWFAPAGPTLPGRVPGLALGVVVTLGYPLLTLAGPRSPAGMEVFAVAPDPTALTTLGVLVLSDRGRWWCLPMPLATCILSSTLWWGLGWPWGLAAGILAALLTLFTCGQALLRRRR